MGIRGRGGDAFVARGRDGGWRLTGFGCALVPALVAGAAAAHDLGVVGIVQPASGCMLSATETVRIRFRNFGPTLPGGSIIRMAFTVDGGPEVSEGVLFGNGPRANTASDYVFVNFTADVSAPGDHVIEGRITYADDPNHANDASSAVVHHWPQSQAGTLSGPAAATDAGTLQLTGLVGTVVEWQQSIDALRWQRLANTAPAQGFSALARPTWFRATVKNGPCPETDSNAVRVDNISLFRNGFES
jgi:hypothetical protein